MGCVITPECERGPSTLALPSLPPSEASKEHNTFGVDDVPGIVDMEELAPRFAFDFGDEGMSLVPVEVEYVFEDVVGGLGTVTRVESQEGATIPQLLRLRPVVVQVLGADDD